MENVSKMEFLTKLVQQNKQNYFIGSYVYNRIIKNSDDYNDVDIIASDVDEFYKQITKCWKCKILKGRVGEYGEYSWLEIKCEEFEKKINIIEYLYAKYRLPNINNIYDFQKILYNGKEFSSMSNMDVKQVIQDYKHNLTCYIPEQLRSKDVNRFQVNKKNYLLCLFQDLKFKYGQKF